MSSQRFGLWAGMLGMLQVTLAGAEPIDIDQLVALKRMGFTDEQVAQEAAESVSEGAAPPGAAQKSSGIDLTADAIARLRAAGAGDVLIGAVCNIAKKITATDVLEMVNARQSTEQMVERILASCPSPCVRPGIAIEDARSLMARQLPAAVIVALAGKPLGPQQLIMLGESKTSRELFEELADTLGLETSAPSPEQSQFMTAAGVPADILIALAGQPLGVQQLIALAEAESSPETFDKLADKLGLDPVVPTAEQMRILMDAGAPQTILDRIRKAEADKSLREHDTARQAWEKTVEPYRKLYESLVGGAARGGDKLTLLLPNLSQLTATYFDTPKTYYIGGTKESGAESFVAPMWQVTIPEPGFHFFSRGVDVSFAVRRDDSGSSLLYRIEDGDRVSNTPLAAGVAAFAEPLGIDIPPEPQQPALP